MSLLILRKNAPVQSVIISAHMEHCFGSEELEVAYENVTWAATTAQRLKCMSVRLC